MCWARGAQSIPLPVVSGIPQGSVLRLLLFLVYIDGASTSVLHSKIAMYANDIVVYTNIKMSPPCVAGYLSTLSP